MAADDRHFRLAAKSLHLIATRGTAAALEEAGLPCQAVYKVNEGRPNIVDYVKNAEIEKGGELDEAGSSEVLARMAKQYRDSITTFGAIDVVKRNRSSPSTGAGEGAGAGAATGPAAG